MKIDLDRNSNKLLFLLISADLVFVTMHVIYLNAVLTNPLLSIEMDRGYAEIYQYVKEYWIILMLLLLAVKNGKAIFLAWSILFMYLLMDDAMQIHERLGSFFADYFEIRPALNLRAQDFGELGVSLLFGSLLFLMIGIVHWLSDTLSKHVSRNLFLLVMSIAFFGVFVDMAQIAIPWGKQVSGMLDDGGEMIIMSVAVWYVFGLDFASKNSAVAKT